MRLPWAEEEKRRIVVEEFKTAVYGAGLRELYRRRWGIETKYDVVKNRLELENFSGRTVENVKQDYYAMMTPANAASILIGAAEEERERIEGAGGEERKYEYTVKVNHAIGLIKDRFIRVIYTGGKAKRRRLMEGLIEQIAPARPGGTLSGTRRCVWRDFIKTGNPRHERFRVRRHTSRLSC